MDEYRQNKMIEAKVAHEQAMMKLESRRKSGANWFFWIAGLSLVNTVATLFDSGWSFGAGLGITQIVDWFFYGFTQGMESGTAVLARAIGVVISVLFAAFFAMCGLLANKRRTWAWYVGGVAYALDSIIMIWGGLWMGLIIHVLAISGLWNGLKAQREMDALVAKDPLPPAEDVVSTGDGRSA